MRTKYVLQSLVTYFVALSFLTNCSRSTDNQKVKAQKDQVAKERSLLEQKEKDLQERQLQLTIDQADFDKKVASLYDDRKTWDDNRSARELELVELANGVKAKTEALEALTLEIVDLNTSLNEKKAELEALREVQATEKQKLESELEKVREEIKTANASELEKLKAKEQSLDEQLTKNKEQSERLAEQESVIVRREAELAVAQAKQLELEKNIKARQEKLDQTIALAREMFLKEGLGDVLSDIEKGKKIQFLVTVNGRGAKKYIEEIREAADRVNGEAVQHAQLTQLPQTQVTQNGQAIDTFFVDDRMIVSATVEDIKKLRDSTYEKMQAENSKGVANSQTQLFLVVRPIHSVRFALDISMTGSKALGMEDRRSAQFISLKQIRPIETKVYAVSDVDLANPSRYVFGNESDARKCNRLDQECVKTMLRLGFLDHSYVLKRGDASETITLSARDTVAGALEASVAQMRADHEMLGKNFNLLGMSFSYEGDMAVGFDLANVRKMIEIKAGNGSVKSMAGILFGMGEERAPIIDQIQMTYRVTVVDTVNMAGNHLDTWKYLSAGFIQDVPLYDMAMGIKRGSSLSAMVPNLSPKGIVDQKDRERNELVRARHEIEIQLPVKGLKVLETKYQDLSMKDYKGAKKPTRPNLDAPGLSAAKAKELKAKYNQELTNYYKNDNKSRVAEFRKRLQDNSSEQFVLFKEFMTQEKQ